MRQGNTAGMRQGNTAGMRQGNTAGMRQGESGRGRLGSTCHPQPEGRDPLSDLQTVRHHHPDSARYPPTHPPNSLPPSLSSIPFNCPNLHPLHNSFPFFYPL
ncbi:hypothetical protein Pmani_039491 [Petrolisthes manimaculis]|uniref:Uncharacterized protein n=1 Tax=Petrolisthes manimaculis TaxID=1843537 RepID=A0AAE1NE21_9EUCA|nr:hypothetical protein Pmani_039491 [Petrolisthes manimaculis]